jgi:copper chaperone CopZ
MLELDVPDITCEKCAQTIQRAVGKVDSTASCEVDVGAKRVRVNSALPPSDFVEALEEVGYPSILVSAVG